MADHRPKKKKSDKRLKREQGENKNLDKFISSKSVMAVMITGMME